VEKRYILGPKAVHAPLNGLQEGDGAVASFCRPNKAMLNAEWVSGEVTCGVCLQRINSAQVEAEKLNEAYEAGVMAAKIWLESVGNDLGESYVTYNDLFLHDERDNLSKWLHRFLGSEKTTWSNRVKSVSYYAHRLTVVEAEIARRKRARGIPACKAGCQLVHDVAEAERIAHIMNPRNVMFEIGLDQSLQLRTREVPAEPMVTENNYGEKGPRFCFTDHPHDQVRAERYDSICYTLLEMVAKANRPAPTTKQMINAILGLEHGEAIEEHRARFPYESFHRLDTPYLVGHRLDHGIIERVRVVGTDVSRRVYKQNMVLIQRAYGMVQPVPEGDLVPNDSF